jgi:hypothetical protein
MSLIRGFAFKFVEQLLDVNGPRLGFVQDEFQPRCVFQNDAMPQFALDVSVLAAKRVERALFP